MSTTTSVTSEQETVPVTLDDLTYFEVGDTGLLCFIGLQKDICEKVESLGFQIYYLMTWEKYYKPISETSTTLSTSPSYRPAFFKVVNNMVSRTVMDAVDIPLDAVESTYQFLLPKIPYEMINKLDKLFRAVDKKYHTESIVILTYDTEYEGADGWGFIVPTQENTSTFCDYEPESVADKLPPTAYIVGSAHSHPNMRAYASGTDHKDQADFDGIHITYGWSATTKGETEYHVEIQAHGGSVTIPYTEVFETAPDISISEDELDSFMENVSKKSSVVHVVGKAPGAPGSSNYGTGYSAYNSSAYGNSNEYNRIKNYPKDGPDLKKNIIVGVVPEGSNFCQFCNSVFIDADIERRRCMSCHQYFLYEGESVQDIVNVRNLNNIYTFDIDIESGMSTSKIYLWRNQGQSHSYACVYDPNSGK